jgi:hypothetical protein
VDEQIGPLLLPAQMLARVKEIAVLHLPVPMLPMLKLMELLLLQAQMLDVGEASKTRLKFCFE